MLALTSLPTPRLWGPLLAAEYWLHPGAFLDRCEKLGDRFLLRLPGSPPLVCTTSPADVRTIFTGDQTALHLGAAVKKMAPHELVLGSSSLTVKDGDEHLRDRRRLNPYFAGAGLKAYESGMAEATRQALCEWPIGEPVSFQRLMRRLTLDIIISTVFGVGDPDRFARVREAVLRFLRVIGGPGFLAFSIVAVARGGHWDGRHRRLRIAMAAVDALVKEEITERRARGDLARNDVLAVLLRLQAEHGDEMSDTTICETMRTLLIGGYETTAASLAWTAERLARHPEVLEQLEDSVARGEDDYVDAVVAEALRVRPVFAFTARLVVKPFEIDGLPLEPGTMVAPFIALLHRRPDLYPDPSAFRPERFLGKKPGPYTWIPFGGGVRHCLGGPFALLEMRVVLRTMFQDLRMRATKEPDEAIARRNVTLVPAKGAMVTLESSHE